MTARPIYTIVVEDMVSHVEWTLMRDDDEVVAGRVELADGPAEHAPIHLRVGYATSVAWYRANQERTRRLVEDLEGTEEQHLAKIEQELGEAELQDALDEGGSW
jgi:hypothetical protein